MLKREDVYYIVVPIVTWVISLLCTYIFNNITGTKQWRLKREKFPLGREIYRIFCKNYCYRSFDSFSEYVN